MSAATFLAQFWGISFVILSILFLIRRENLQKYIKVAHDEGTMIIAGYISLAMGIASILVHNVWALNWRGIVTLIGWIALVKGIALLGFPEVTKKVANIYKNDGSLMIAMFGMLIIGIILAIKGFGL